MSADPSSSRLPGPPERPSPSAVGFPTVRGMTFDPAGPPIIPGASEPYTLASVMPAPERPRRPAWVIPVITALTVLLMGAVGAVVVLASNPGTPMATPSTTSPTLRQNIPAALRTAYTRCGGVGEISDGDKTLYVNTQGEKANSGTASITELYCVLDSLEPPSYVTIKMRQTRAFDGQVSEKWGSFEASWTFHPDAGLDVLIRDLST
jgi:hypothetical protein